MTTALEAEARAQVERVVPGLSVLVANADGTLDDTSVGLADRATGVEATSSVSCNWFSMTKVVTATAVVQLADRNLLDLDDPVVHHYEPFAALRPEARTTDMGRSEMRRAA